MIPPPFSAIPFCTVLWLNLEASPGYCVRISRLVEELKLERETSESDKAAALTQFDAMMARQVEKARSEGREEGMAVVMERVAKLEEELSISNETLAGARQEAAEARKELEILGGRVAGRKWPSLSGGPKKLLGRGT